MKDRRKAIAAALTAAGEPAAAPCAVLATTYDLSQGAPLALRHFYEQALEHELEYVYNESWPTDQLELGPGTIFRDEGDFANMGVFNVFKGERKTLALVTIRNGSVFLTVASSDRGNIDAAIGVFRERYPFAAMPTDDLVPVTFWSYGKFGPQSYTRRITVASWDEITSNYSSDVRDQLADVMQGFEPGKGGQMLLWQGPPGTAKTWALRALASEWRSWADVHYITDPDAFFGEHADYMVEVLLRESYNYDVPEGDEPVEKWRLLVLEDTGELLASDAKQKSGQALSRLLNVVDGLIGQGLRVLVLVTTNDEITSFHPAVTRPGRCASQIEFGPLDPQEASEWLGEDVQEPMTIAELYARGPQPAEDADLVAAAFAAPTEGLHSEAMKRSERMKEKRQRHARVRVSPARAPAAASTAERETLAGEDLMIESLAAAVDSNGDPIEATEAPVELPLSAEEAEALTVDLTAPAEVDANATTSALAWNATLVPEGTPTDDGRMFAEGAVSWRELPLTLMAQIVTADGHDEAQVCGRIDAIWRDGSMIRASGVFDDGEYGREIARLVDDRVLRGISVDIAVREYELVAKNADEEGEADLLDILLGGEDMIFMVTDGVIGAVTVCSFPAFEQASISLAASGAGKHGLVWTLQMQSGMVITKGPDDEAPAPPALTAAAAGLAPVTPPASWFEDPELSEATPLTISDDGQLFGHIALWGTCHIGLPACTQPPTSDADYAFFHLGELQVDRGDGDDLGSVSVGKITLGTGHAGSRLSMQRTLEHYDNTGSAVADVIAGEDEYGIWIAGALRPDLSVERVRELRAATLSGDWREQDGNLELCAVLAVNVPGFPVPRPRALIAASDDDGSEQVLALTAAGVLPAASTLSEEDRAKLDQLVDRARGGFGSRFAELAARARA